MSVRGGAGSPGRRYPGSNVRWLDRGQGEGSAWRGPWQRVPGGLSHGIPCPAGRRTPRSRRARRCDPRGGSVCAARYRFERRAVARGGRGAGPGTGRAARWRGVAGYPRPGQATAVDLLRRLQRLIRMSPEKAVGMQPRPTAGRRGARGPGRRFRDAVADAGSRARPEEHTYELQSLMRISYAVFCLKKKTKKTPKYKQITRQT